MKTYTYDQAIKDSKEYFNGEELPAKVFVDKYALKDNDENILENTPVKLHKRLAKEFARIEKKKFKNPLTEEQIFNYLDRFAKIIPQGSLLYGIGNKYKYISLSNCYVLDEPEDSYNGILTTDLQLVNIAKRRGGNGISLNKLRPVGTATQNSSHTSTGIVPFMERYSNSTREVGQSNRRGALMQTISVHHPQVSDFINVKRDKTKVTGANISVQYTDEFLNAVENNRKYTQEWPINDQIPVISKEVNAKDIWNQAVQAAWDNAEPGVQFIDNILRESPADCYASLGFKTITTNPCQPAWAKILTSRGIRKLGDIQIGDLIWSTDGWTTVKNKWSTGVKDVYKYTTTAGVFYGTKNHRVVDKDNKIEIQDAECINIITGPTPICSNINLQDVMDGLVLGDGGIHKASGDLIGLYIGVDDQDYFNHPIQTLIKKHRPGISNEFYEVNTNITAKELPDTYLRRVPDRYIYGDSNTVCGFLMGLYSANGSVCGNRITLKSASLQIIEDVQSMLSSIGIRSYYTTNKSQDVKFSNGTYTCKQSYDLNITVDREKFIRLIGFVQEYKNDKINIVPVHRTKEYYDIVSVEKISQEEVFDITVDGDSNTYWTQGCNVSNCSELPLSVLDSCRLLVVNLMACVDNPFTEDAKFNFSTLKELSTVAQRLMDDVIDLELECIDRIIKKVKSDPEPDHIKYPELSMWERIRDNCHNGRRTGTGITGLGDVFASLGITYGSENSIELANKIMREFKIGCYSSSVNMAKELGSFPIFNKDLEKDNPFLLRIKDEAPLLYADMQRYGRRNIALLTIAPTGSISILAGFNVNNTWYHNTTSGIEPCFTTSYKRRKKINHNDNISKVDFVDDLGDKWTEFDVYHLGVKAWYNNNSDLDINDSPYSNSTADKIDWTKRVELQGVIQQHIDHSISSTVNLPSTATAQDVDNIFRTAWKKGLKGITVYRDGCRSGVLVTNEKTKDFTEKKRPKKLECEVHHVSIRGQQYFVLVGILDGEPYEVFAGKNGFIPKTVKRGEIVRKKRGYYKAEFENDTELSPITAAMSEEEEIISRLTSGLLRTNASIHFIVKQLERVGETKDINSFARGIARTLKKYIPDGTKDNEQCPECQGELHREEGCKKCSSCGWSKCL